MTNDECQMTKEVQNPNYRTRLVRGRRDVRSGEFCGGDDEAGAEEFRKKLTMISEVLISSNARPAISDFGLRHSFGF